MKKKINNDKLFFLLFIPKILDKREKERRTDRAGSSSHHLGQNKTEAKKENQTEKNRRS